MHDAYAELRCRTHYSFLRGASHPRECVETAHALGLRALAIADRDGVYGIPKAFRAAERLRGAGHPFHLITGAELSIASGASAPDRFHLPLLARDRAGYGLLCRALTASHAGREKGDARLDWDAFTTLLSRPEAAGLVALPAVDADAPLSDPIWGTLRDLFPGRVFAALSRALDGRDVERDAQARAVARRHGLRIVAVNDAHYHAPERRMLQDTLSAIRAGVTVEALGFAAHANAERRLKSPAEMAALFADLPDALRATVDIAESCRFSPGELRYFYPLEDLPPGLDAQSFLVRLVEEGAARRYPAGVPPDVRRQLAHELALIEQLKFADYFLTIWEIVEFARSRDILCQGRGSAANSVVCYCLEITAIDPVRMNLLFERFLSTERGEPPDIDVDFEHARREEVIQHIYEKYGRDRAGMVCNYVCYRDRSAKREVAKALGSAEHPWTERLEAEIEGTPRHLSIHSGGFTLSRDPLIETVPIEPARMEGRTVIQWDKDDLDAIGLVKVDVLALGMLTALKRTLDQVGLTLYDVPPDDPATYAMIQAADTVGVFQIESRAQMGMLPRLLPKNFYDLVVQIAIVRPGPIQGEMVHPYLRRRRGEEPVDLPHPALEPILGRTFGVPIFQEQVMKMAVVLAGFTPGEADELRRAIGAWRSSGSIEKMGHRLVAGLLASGLPRDFVDRILKQIHGFAEYGFPESHSASFAILAYASSYLKCHFPAEFAAALINAQPMGFYPTHALVDDAKRHGVEVRPVHPNRSGWDCVMEGARGRNTAPDAQRSPPALRLGWRVISGLGEERARRIVSARQEREFTSVADFTARAGVPARNLATLAWGGVFDAFGRSRREALWEILGITRLLEPDEGATVPPTAGVGGNSMPTAGVGGNARPVAPLPRQLSLFSGFTADVGGGKTGLESRTWKTNPGAPPVAPFFTPLGPLGEIRADYEAQGLSAHAHPMRYLRGPLRGRRFSPSGRKAETSSWREITIAHVHAPETRDGARIEVGGCIIARQRPPTAKGVCFASLEDESGILDLVMFPQVYERVRATLKGSEFLVARGRVQRDGGAVHLIVDGLEPLELPGSEEDFPVPRGKWFS